MLLFGLCLDVGKDVDTREGQGCTPGTDCNIDSQGFGMCLDTLVGDLKVSRTGSESKESKEEQEAKATKEDNAEVPIHLWNERVLQDWSKRNNQEDAGWKLETIRDKFLLRRWKQNLQRSLVAHLNDKFGVDWLDESPRSTELKIELDAGTDALSRAMDTTWWSWESSSALFSGDGRMIFNSKLVTERPSGFQELYHVTATLKV
jgi:hypothetical protein